MAETNTAAKIQEDPKRNHKKEVCRYWLKSACQKGLQCEFLHEIDYQKMPMCSSGDYCINPECFMTHPDPTRPICSNYQIGFCSFGKRCLHRHVHSNVLPQISPYWTLEDGTSTYAQRKEGLHFRKKVCDYFLNNKWCPYFDMCNFKH
jgi:hypothetical protein